MPAVFEVCHNLPYQIFAIVFEISSEFPKNCEIFLKILQIQGGEPQEGVYITSPITQTGANKETS